LAEKDKAPGEGEEQKFLRYATFFSRHKWRIVGAVSLVIGVLLVIGLVQSLRKRNEAKAFAAYRKAQTAEQYKRVGENFRGTSYGSFSVIEAGNLYFKSERYAEARKMYLKFLRSYPKSRLRPWVYNLAGSASEGEKRYDEAIGYYRKAEASASLKLQAKLNIGRCYELKGDAESERNPQLALEHYEVARTYYGQLTETGSSSPRTQTAVNPWQRQAQSRINFLQEKEKKAREGGKKS
jgi:tetratricopeptide (TPR) repeat protein